MRGTTDGTGGREQEPESDGHDGETLSQRKSGVGNGKICPCSVAQCQGKSAPMVSVGRTSEIRGPPARFILCVKSQIAYLWHYIHTNWCEVGQGIRCHCSWYPFSFRSIFVPCPPLLSSPPIPFPLLQALSTVLPSDRSPPT